MQDRRYRPGDVLDDYCPRERRITDHAIVAMVDEEIQRTRCASCDAEHEYKAAKVPASRRKTQPPALFAQVLENLQGATPRPQSATSAPSSEPPEPVVPVAAPEAAAPPAADGNAAPPATPADDQEREGGFRRSLIRATFPKVEGQTPAPRALPEFTIQSLNNRGRNNGGAQRNAGGQNKFRGRRRPAAGGSQDNLGPMRFRDHNSQTGGGQGQGQQGQGQQGQGPQGQGPGQGGRRRRGGKKNR
jgi:translation initiation factor IF-2